MAGQVIMQGFLHWEIPVWIRRVVTMIPALIVILIGLDPTRTLIISQVVLSFGLPFAIIPLVMFTSRRKLMKTLVNRWTTTLAASLVTAIIVSLNIYLLFQIFTGH
jgi:manganese transport protein